MGLLESDLSLHLSANEEFILQSHYLIITSAVFLAQGPGNFGILSYSDNALIFKMTFHHYS